MQFYETDAAGIVHFSNYFRYMEEAEHALWRAAGLSVIRTAGVEFPRVSVHFDFQRPLHFEDDFDVTIRIVEMREKVIRYACVLTLGPERVATGTMTVVCVRKTEDGLKSSPIPAEIADCFAVATGEP